VRAVIDTNVIAYLLFGEKNVAEESASLVEVCDELLAPTSWKAELLNTVWLAVREGMLPEQDGIDSLAAAELLDILSVDPPEMRRVRPRKLHERLSPLYWGGLAGLAEPHSHLRHARHRNHLVDPLL
jgi:hypothetical protein